MNKKIEKLLEIVEKISKENVKVEDEVFFKDKWKFHDVYDGVIELYAPINKTTACPMFCFKSHNMTDKYHVIFADPTQNDMKGTLLTPIQIYDVFGIDILQFEKDILKSRDYTLSRPQIDLIAEELASHIKILNACKDEQTLEKVIKNMLLPFTGEQGTQAGVDQLPTLDYNVVNPSEFSDSSDESEDDDDNDDDDEEESSF